MDYAPMQWTYVNTEAKYLQLRHCSENLGCRRVELKTDRRNEKSRNAVLRMGAQFEGIARKQMLTLTAPTATPAGLRSSTTSGKQ